MFIFSFNAYNISTRIRQGYCSQNMSGWPTGGSF